MLEEKPVLAFVERALEADEGVLVRDAEVRHLDRRKLSRRKLARHGAPVEQGDARSRRDEPLDRPDIPDLDDAGEGAERPVPRGEGLLDELARPAAALAHDERLA